MSLLQGNAHKPGLRLIRSGFPGRPAFSTGVSEALLQRVGGGELDATLRLHRPGRELAFSKQDRAAAGFHRAVEAARLGGFEPVVRLAGGRAAVFHEGTLAIAWSIADHRPIARTQARFEELAEIVTRALSALGLDARIGEVPGEYCPGAWSVNARGRTKLAGIGQRLITGAAHRGAVVVAEGADLVRAALEPTYEALGLDWDPQTAGSVGDEVPGLGLREVEDALLAELEARYELEHAELDARTLELAARLERNHLP